MSTHPATVPQDDDARARRNVAVLVAAQAVLGAQMPMIFTVGGLAGQMLAPNPCFATLPISMIVLASGAPEGAEVRARFFRISSTSRPRATRASSACFCAGSRILGATRCS